VVSDQSNAGSTGTVSNLATLLSEAARSWAAEGSLQDTLIAIAFSAVDTIPGADYAGVSLIHSPHTITTPAATDDLVREADSIQSFTGEGPCVDALWERRTVRVDDLRTDPRWPTFGPSAVALGVASMLAFRLYTGDDSWGALNLYSRMSNAFDQASEFVGILFASHASIALAGSQQLRQLTVDMSTQRLVERAIGILMERCHVGAGDARDMLVATTGDGTVSLAKAAAQVIDSR
jgi:GAF domain-containing protein